LSPIVVIPKKNGTLGICIDFRKLNVAIKKDPYPLPFIDEMLNTIAWYEAYLGYHQISIALEDRYKIAFVTDWGAFIWKVMPFGMKNGPLTYERVVIKTSKEYLDNFMKIFLDDFIVYSDMESPMHKFKLCFQKCKEYGISLNIDKCASMVFFRDDLGFYCFQKRETTRSKEDTSNSKHATTLESTIDSSIQWDGIVL
jgi:hypothetical protein